MGNKLVGILAAAIAAASLLLQGCEPTVFGMPQNQFNQLDNQQKQAVIQSYNQREATKAELAPVLSAVNVLGQAANVGKTVPISNSSECHMEGNTQVCNSSSSSMHFGW